MTKYTIKATGILPDGTKKDIAVTIKTQYQETYASLKGRLYDMIEPVYISVIIDSVEEENE